MAVKKETPKIGYGLIRVIMGMVKYAMLKQMRHYKNKDILNSFENIL